MAETPRYDTALGSVDLPDREEFKYVGKYHKVGYPSYPIVTGQAAYPRDLSMPGMLFGKMLKSTHGHCSITINDISKAEALPGVKAILTYESPEVQGLPGIGAYSTYPGATKMAVFSNEADFEGDELGIAVAAESEEICDEALKLIDITYTPLPSVINTREAYAEGAPTLQQSYEYERNTCEESLEEAGDVEAALQEAEYTLEYPVKCNQGYHNSASPITSTAWWGINEQGEETLFISGESQGTNSTTTVEMRQFFGLNYSTLRWVNQFAACSFGGRPYNRRIHLVAALLSKKAGGAPVKIAYSRAEECTELNWNLWGEGDIKIGFTDEGKLTAYKGEMYTAYGGRGSFQLHISYKNLHETHCENYSHLSHCVFTSTPRVSACRGWIAANLTLCTVMQRIAAELDMDLVEVYRNNLKSDISAPEVLRIGTEAFKWSDTVHKAGELQLPNGRMHGQTVALRGQESAGRIWSGIDLMLKGDGNVYLTTNRAHFGVYIEDAVALVVAEELEISPERVIPVFGHSFTTQGDFGTGWSSGGSTVSWVARRAALNLRHNILKFYSRTLRTPVEYLELKDGIVSITGSEFSVPIGTYASAPIIGSYLGKCDVRPEISTLNAIFCEVEVDTETGQVFITRWVGATDGGKVMRPSSYLGQVEGGLFWNHSTALMEEFISDPATHMHINTNSIEYKMPTTLDMPPIETPYVETRTSSGCYGSTGIGEEIFDTSIIIGAVHNAIGKWIDSEPITPDKVLKALGKA